MSSAKAAAAGASDDPADAVLRALADPHRREILRLVRVGELPAGEIASHFDASQQAVSHHLQVLARAGLLSERRDGVRRLYALDPHGLDPVREVLSELWPSALRRLKQVVEDQQAKKPAKGGGTR
ncbi:MAG TPA: metalloregulator ArsR/SmtB family transcription factor [Mycobacteriales bacterium]|jgi:DNA-binding transcriptional ArsR family regulator|nr:metalloregulator ArsR/SmtB family transcription factor [Mycobacteriales bacterium]